MTPLFTQFTLSHASDNTRPTSRIIGGDGCVGRPPPQIWGDRPPSPPKSQPMAQLHAKTHQ